MKLRKVVLLWVVSLILASSAFADMTCVSGIGWTDECGQFHCSFSTYSGTCLLCSEEIDVKG